MPEGLSLKIVKLDLTYPVLMLIPPSVFVKVNINSPSHLRISNNTKNLDSIYHWPKRSQENTSCKSFRYACVGEAL